MGANGSAETSPLRVPYRLPLTPPPTCVTPLFPIRHGPEVLVRWQSAVQFGLADPGGSRRIRGYFCRGSQTTVITR